MMKAYWQVRVSPQWRKNHPLPVVRDRLIALPFPDDDIDPVTFAELVRTYSDGSWDRIIWSNRDGERTALSELLGCW